MDKDLISRSALLRRVPVNRKDTGKTAWDWGILYMADIIKTIPAVDAVEVVRCKDCKWLCSGFGLSSCGKHTGLALIKPDGSDFCSYGERRRSDG